jgi:hypothetical protein
VLPHEPGGERVHLDEVADLGVVPVPVQREILVHEVGVFRESAVHVARGEDDHLTDAVLGAVIQELPRAADVDVVALCRPPAEVPNEPHVDDDGRGLLAEDVFELTLSDVDLVEGDAGWAVLPAVPVRAHHLVMLQHLPREKSPLPSGDADDQHLLHGLLLLVSQRRVHPEG